MALRTSVRRGVLPVMGLDCRAGIAAVALPCTPVRFSSSAYIKSRNAPSGNFASKGLACSARRARPSSVAMTTTASTTGLVIPPSNIMIIYAVVTGNVHKGTGTLPINAIDAQGVVLDQLLQQNNISGWSFPATPLTVYASAFHVWVWIAIFLIPLVAKPIIHAKRLIPLPRGKTRQIPSN